MPNRIIKQSICTSESMADLSWFEQALFIRLILSADDYGRYDARPAIIRGALFPLDDVTVKAIDVGIHKLSTHGMVHLYEVGGRMYLELTAWFRHNTPRAKESKYPAPTEECVNMNTSASTCKHLQADVPDIRNSDSVFDIRNSDSENICSERSAAPSEPPAITLLLNDKSEYPVCNADVSEWQALYPAVDVMQELRKMRLWCKDNPNKRKTYRGIRRFISGWLDREQNKGHSYAEKASGNQSADNRRNAQFIQPDAALSPMMSAAVQKMLSDDTLAEDNADGT